MLKELINKREEEKRQVLSDDSVSKLFAERYLWTERQTSILLIERLLEELDGMKKKGMGCGCYGYDRAISNIQASLQKDLEELKK